METRSGHFMVAWDVGYRTRDLGGMGIHYLCLLNAALHVLVLAFPDRSRIQDRSWQGLQVHVASDVAAMFVPSIVCTIRDGHVLLV